MHNEMERLRSARDTRLSRLPVAAGMCTARSRPGFAVLENVMRSGGPGAEIAARISESLFGELASPVARLGTPHTPLPFAGELNVFPTPEDIVSVVKGRIGR
jgi:pyruvate/2-oxoglutarate/acetoin dehydrogenase E1 component